MIKLSETFDISVREQNIFGQLYYADFEIGLDDDNLFELAYRLYYNNGLKSLNNMAEQIWINSRQRKDVFNAAIANTLSVFFKNKWTKLYSMINTEYDPLHNFNVTEDSLIVENLDYLSENNNKVNAFPNEQAVDYNSNANNQTSERTLKRNNSRVGNIGNIMTQDMFNKELEVRKNLFYDIVIKDIVNFITLPIYE